MSKSKRLSNPFSTGGGGERFEAHVQAAFVTLMFTGGYAPCLPSQPIVEITLQGKIDGYNTDDLIVVVEENAPSKERRKLLGQIKHSIDITQSSIPFGKVIQDAWNDFNNSDIFAKKKDVIALITGPLSKVDSEVAWLLNHARTNLNDPARFFRNISTSDFSSDVKRRKLEVFRHHLKIINGGDALEDEIVHAFLKNFYLIGYDLGEEKGSALSLIKSHISQFKPKSPDDVWNRILAFTNNRNQHASCITRADLPEGLTKIFVAEPPENLTRPQTPSTDWTQHPDATYLALIVLIGAWNENIENDTEKITRLLGINYTKWLKKMRKILHRPDSPLSLKNGIWTASNRAELWKQLGSCIFDQNLDAFGSLAVSVLKEPDPAFELPAEERYAASIHGKAPKYSTALRRGIAEGLAILGSMPAACSHCSQGKVETTCLLILRKLLSDADWALWGSLNNLLPALAEAAPGEFLTAVEKAIRLTSCPFDELFSQEGGGIIGRNYLTGLLWALEGLAWDEQHLVQVCVVLAELASHDPGGQSANRPLNSLATILLPWLPQTLAPADKRKVAVQTILKEQPDIAWNLILQLLPSQHRISVGSYKPIWRKTIPENWKKDVTREEYRRQASFYAELAVETAGQNVNRLSTLIDRFNNLPESAFDQLLEVLSSQAISTLPEEQRLSIWEHLTNAKRVLLDEQIIRIEQVAKQLSPTNPLNLYKHLFTERELELYDGIGDWAEQQKKLNKRRELAISEIIQQNGPEVVIRFAESVSSPRQVGYALGAISDAAIERALLPRFLDTPDNRHKALVGAFIWERHIDGWGWCDSIDTSGWTTAQTGQFLAYLPFTRETWNRASKWLQKGEHEYWNHTNAYWTADGDLSTAVDKLIKYGRPRAAIYCLHKMLRDDKRLLDTHQCVRALLTAPPFSEPDYGTDEYCILELIKFLQGEPSVNQNDLCRVEWAYLPLLDGHEGADPQQLESGLANDPDFFCEAIRLLYRSRKENKPSEKPTEESRAIAENAWQLLHKWKTPPGTQEDGTFNGERFTKWLQSVKASCMESGHLEAALTHIGAVLIHTPPDPDGLWIHRTVAAALNDPDADEIRNGFSRGKFNSRGAHRVDPTGEPEKELAEQFREKAEKVENASFHRLAVTLRDLATRYDREAEGIIAAHKRGDE